MMSKLLAKIIKFNGSFFPFIIFASYIALSLETYSYIGFLKQYIFVDSRFFLVLALISMFLVIKNNEEKNDFFERIKNVIIKINNFFLPVLSVVYLVMQALEASHYHNYIFSKIHIQQDNFLYLVILSASIFLISKLGRKINFKKNISMLIVSSILVFVLIENLIITINEAVYSDLFVATHTSMTYDEKMQNYWGIYFEYITFIKNNTPEDSTIIVPPQESPWFMTGNIALDRYFLYPREFIHGTYNQLFDLKFADYVMIAWGEWKENDISRYGWPKVNIDSEKIIYMNEDKNWGVIKIKK